MKDKIIKLLNKKLIEKINDKKYSIIESAKMKKLKTPFSVGSNIAISGLGRDGNGNRRLYYITTTTTKNRSIQIGEFSLFDISDLTKEKFTKLKDFDAIIDKIKLYSKGK